MMENGDIEIDFASSLYHSSLSSNSPTVKFDVRFGINSECKDKTMEVLDMTAMLESSKPKIIVNGGWFRRAGEIYGMNNDCKWEPVVMEAIVTDPDSSYPYISHLHHTVEITVMSDVQSHGNAHCMLSVDELNRRHTLLSARASPNHEMEITKEISMGRKSKDNTIFSSNLSSGS